eukprot:5188409-Amphidinium_carterae.1
MHPILRVCSAGCCLGRGPTFLESAFICGVGVFGVWFFEIWVQAFESTAKFHQPQHSRTPQDCC